MAASLHSGCRSEARPCLRQATTGLPSPGMAPRPVPYCGPEAATNWPTAGQVPEALLRTQPVPAPTASLRSPPPPHARAGGGGGRSPDAAPGDGGGSGADGSNMASPSLSPGKRPGKLTFWQSVVRLAGAEQGFRKASRT